MTTPGRIGGRYALVRPLGAGGMGEVWLATDERLGGKPVALKRMPPLPASGSSGEADAAMFRREAHAAAGLRHPNIVAVTDFFVEGGSPVIVMDYIAGRPLDALIPATGLAPQIALRVGRDVAGALAATHAAGLVHRDVKPSNIIIDESGAATLVDFGIARRDEDPRLTGTGLLRGTLAYLAPEVFDGSRATAAGDMWALGATLYEAACGHVAFDGPTQHALMAAIIIKPLPRANSGTVLDEVIAALLDRDAGARPTAAQTLGRLTAGAPQAGREDRDVTRVAVAGAWYGPPLRSDPTPAALAAPVDPGPPDGGHPDAARPDPSSSPSQPVPPPRHRPPPRHEDLSPHPSGPFAITTAAPDATRRPLDLPAVLMAVLCLAACITLFLASFRREEPENFETTWTGTDRLGPLTVGLLAAGVCAYLLSRRRRIVAELLLLGAGAGLLLQYVALLGLYLAYHFDGHVYETFETVRILVAAALVVAATVLVVRHRGDVVRAHGSRPVRAAWVAGLVAVVADVWSGIETNSDSSNSDGNTLVASIAPYLVVGLLLLALFRPGVRGGAAGWVIVGVTTGIELVLGWDLLYLFVLSHELGTTAAQTSCVVGGLASAVAALLGVRALVVRPAPLPSPVPERA